MFDLYLDCRYHAGLNVYLTSIFSWKCELPCYKNVDTMLYTNVDIFSSPCKQKCHCKYVIQNVFTYLFFESLPFPLPIYLSIYINMASKIIINQGTQLFLTILSLCDYFCWLAFKSSIVSAFLYIYTKFGFALQRILFEYAVQCTYILMRMHICGSALFFLCKILQLKYIFSYALWKRVYFNIMYIGK